MPTITFETGQKITTDRVPSAQDIEEIAQQLQLSPTQAGAQESAAPAEEPGYESVKPASHENPLTAFPKGVARGVVEGGQSMIGTGVNTYELLSKLLGQTPSQDPRKFLEASQSGLNELLPSSGTFSGSLGEGVGNIPGMVATFENPVTQAAGAVPVAAGLGAINAQQGGAGAMALGGAESAAQLALLGKAQEMNPIPGALSGAAITGIPAALQGENKNDVASQSVLGAGFSLFDHTGNLKDLGPVTKNIQNIISDPKGAYKGFVDKMGESQRKFDALHKEIDNEEKILKDRLSGADVQTKYNAGSVNKNIQGRTAAEQAFIESQKTQSERDKEARIQKVKQAADASSENLKTKIEAVQARMPEEAVAQANFVQDNLPKMKKEMYSNYEPFLDNMASTIDAKLVDNPGDTAAFLDGAAAKIAESHGYDPNNPNHMLDAETSDRILKGINDIKADIVKPSPLEFLKQRYPVLSSMNFEDPKVLKPFLRDNPSIAREVQSAMRSEKSQQIPFEQLYGRLKSLIRSGGYGNNSAGILAVELGDFIANKTGSNEFRNAQSSYRDSISYVNKLSEIFSLKRGEASLAKGATFLEKVPGAKVSTAQDLVNKKIYDFLRTGKTDSSKYQLTKGLGPIADKIVQYRANMDALGTHLAAQNDVLSQRMVEIAKAHLDRIAELDKAGELTIRKFNLLKTRMEGHFQQALAKEQMNLELTKTSNIKNKKEELKKISNSILRVEGLAGAILTSMGGLGGHAWKLAKFARGGLMAEKVERKYRD